MPNRSADSLFQLIRSLKKSEKRNFKTYVTRNSGGDEDLKVVQLFDVLDKMVDYDEELLLKKAPAIKKQQLSNIKAHLYRLILQSIRLISNDENIDIQLHEQLAFARILYNKGLYHQALKVLARMKEQAVNSSQFTYLQQVLFFEKKIESLFITRSMRDRALQLSAEADEVNQLIDNVSRLSNLSLQLYSWYISNGHARNEEDEKAVVSLFDIHLTAGSVEARSFYEKLYLFQSYCWYAFIRQDFLQYYRYTQKWVDLFESNPAMIGVETAYYIKGYHNLMTAHFDLQRYDKLQETLVKFEAFLQTPVAQQHENIIIHANVYLFTAKINLHFIEGRFSEALYMVPQIEQHLEDYRLFLDHHRILVFYYKIACLYFGSGDNDQAIEYLNRVIHFKTDLRTDLQCYSRLLHLIAHYELGNYDLLEYLIKSVYRFMAKMDNLSVVEEAMFDFLKSSFQLTKKDIRPALEKLLHQLKQYEHNRFETRAFVYLDVISWLESKLAGTPVADVIRKKYLAGR
jgi:tetratricopeptide (TPR) repeat protein